MNSVLLLCFISAIVVSAGLTWMVRDLALKRGWLRGSLSARDLHSTGMPRLGGVAIAGTVATITCSALFVLLAFHMSPIGALGHALLVLSVALMNFGVGVVDDFVDLSAWKKLAAEIFAGLLLWCGGIRVLHLSSVFHSHEFGATVSLLLTILWVVLITNAFNLIDGLDGLAAGSALFSVLTVFVVSLVIRNPMQGLLAAVLAGAILGFLRYNFNPATIFLGDCGSLFIGTFIAGLTLTGATQQKSSTLIAVAIPIVACGFPVVETSVSVIRRFLRGQSIFSADREHIHHKLLDQGWSHRQAVVILYGVSALFGMMSLALLTPGQAPLAIVLAILGIGIVVGVQKMQYHEFFEIGRLARRVVEQKSSIINNLAVRRGAERLARCKRWADIVQVLREIFADNEFDKFVIIIKAESSDAIVLMHQWPSVVSDMDQEVESVGQWSLTFPLALKGDWKGILELSRYGTSPLLIDINLLICELKEELERACNRAVAAQSETQQVASSGYPLHKSLGTAKG